MVENYVQQAYRRQGPVSGPTSQPDLSSASAPIKLALPNYQDCLHDLAVFLQTMHKAFDMVDDGGKARQKLNMSLPYEE